MTSSSEQPARGVRADKHTERINRLSLPPALGHRVPDVDAHLVPCPGAPPGKLNVPGRPLEHLPEPAEELIRRSPELIPAAVKELLRFDAPPQWLTGATRRDVVMHGVTIPAGARVVLPMGVGEPGRAAVAGGRTGAR